MKSKIFETRESLILFNFNVQDYDSPSPKRQMNITDSRIRILSNPLVDWKEFFWWSYNNG